MIKEINVKNTKNYAEVLEEGAIDQMREAMLLDCNVQGALMPDSHKGYTLPIGAVVKSLNTIFPAYVGYDIGCGVSAIKLDIKKEDINLEELKKLIVQNVPVGRNANNKKSVLKSNQLYINKNLKNLKIKDKLNMDKIVTQLGTLGGGNHFLEIGEGNDGKIWIVIHSGSRCFGYQVAEYYMKEAAIENTDEERYIKEFEEKNTWKDHNPKAFEKAKQEFVYRRVRARLSTNIEGHYGLSLDSKRGKDYLNDMNIALEFALENRKRMIYRIVELIGNPKELYFINRNHNHAEIVESNYVIHRKGATHAEKGMDGVIPGNMKDGSFIVKGKGNNDSLNSSSHGAGRVLSRMKAKSLLDYDEFHNLMKGIVTNHTKSTLDESPLAYKNIFEVMNLQKDLVEILDHVKPILNIKG